MKKQQKVVMEVRERTSTGHAIVVGARVESQLPIDRYKTRNELDPADDWRNLMLWQASERLRVDFDMSGIRTSSCSSFTPRISCGNQQSHAERRARAEIDYKKAMRAIAQTLRPCLFYCCVVGDSARDWAVRNGKDGKVGLEILRLALAELADHYGLVKIKSIEI